MARREVSPALSPPEPLRTRFKRPALAALFGVILLIPRLGRLRRRVWPWSAVRSLMVIVGAALVWQFARRGGGMWSLLFGIVLIGFGALVKARPQSKSMDDVARELDALVALNGGTLVDEDKKRQLRGITICVGADRLVAITKARQPVLEIPVGQIRGLQVHLTSAAAGKNQACELAITFGTDAPHTVHFQYEGTFSEHLARIAQDTVISVWKRGLPVVKTR